MKLTKQQRVLITPAAFLPFGGLLLAIGGRFVIYAGLLSRYGEPVIGTVTEATTTYVSGRSVHYLRYQFEDVQGRYHRGNA